MAMRPVFADLVVEIQRSMNFYSTVHRESRIGRIVALGSTFQLPGLQKYLQQNLQMPVEKLDGFAADKPEDAKIAAAFVEHASTLATAYGLAVQALGEGVIKTSLLPEAIQRAKMWKDKTKWFAAAAAAMLLATGAAGGFAFFKQMQYEQNEAIRQTNNSVIQKGKSLIDEWKTEVQGKGDADRTTLAQIQSQHSYRDTWLKIMESIIGSLPPADYAKLKSIPRDKRELLLIDRIQGEYLPNANELLSLKSTDFVAKKDLAGVTNSLDGMGPRLPALLAPTNTDTATATDAAPVDEARNRGYLLMISAHYSNKDDAFLDEKFVKNLLAFDEPSNAKKKADWYIARVEVVDFGPFVQVADNAAGNAQNTLTGIDANIPESDPDLQVEITSPTTFDETGAGGVTNGLFRPVPAGMGGVRFRPLLDNKTEITYDDLSFPGASYKNDKKVRYLVLIMLDPKLPPEDPEKNVIETPDGEKPDGENTDNGDNPVDADKPQDEAPATGNENN